VFTLYASERTHDFFYRQINIMELGLYVAS